MINKKGISMIELVIVLVLMRMIAAFAIFSTASSHLKAEATMLKTEMNNVKKALILVYQKYETQMIDEIEGQEGVLYNEPLKDNSGTIVEDWYVIYGMDSNKYSEEVIENLSLDELKKTYEVNFETKDVRLKDSVTIGEYSIKTYEDLETVLESGAL